MIGKYLKDLGVKEGETPQTWCKDDDRNKIWQEERNLYGFDERETWSLDCTFYLWLYERLKMYNEININDASFYKLKFKNKTISFQDCIDRMLDGLKIAIIINEFKRTEEQQEKVDDIVKIFSLCYKWLWW